VFYPHAFEAPLVRHPIGRDRVLVYTVVFLPPAVAADLPLAGTPLRVEGEIADVPFAGAFQPSRGDWFLMVGKDVLATSGTAVGDVVVVRFRVADPEAVAVPDALAAALEADSAAQAAFATLSPGRRRGLAHRVASAKTPATMARRVAEVMASLADGTAGVRPRR
jgi:hypothetical protein